MSRPSAVRFAVGIAALFDLHVGVAKIDLLDVAGFGVFNVDFGLFNVTRHGLVKGDFMPVVFSISQRMAKPSSGIGQTVKRFMADGGTGHLFASLGINAIVALGGAGTGKVTLGIGTRSNFGYIENPLAFTA